MCAASDFNKGRACVYSRIHSYLQGQDQRAQHHVVRRLAGLHLAAQIQGLLDPAQPLQRVRLERLDHVPLLQVFLPAELDGGLVVAGVQRIVDGLQLTSPDIVCGMSRRDEGRGTNRLILRPTPRLTGHLWL